MEEHCRPGSVVLDLGAQPFIVSCALKRMRYEVVAFDVDPEPYLKIAESCDIKPVKCDLETDELDIGGADCAVFTEVLEHLHYYYVPSILAKINKALKPGGHLILTTPNIASLFRRARLLLGIQPLYRYHVREYTMSEVLTMIKDAGFDIVRAYFSVVNDISLVDTELPVLNYWGLIKVVVKKPTKLNLLRALAYPVVKLIPSLRQLIVVVAVKSRKPEIKAVERWG